jgi:hypothetical protein
MFRVIGELVDSGRLKEEHIDQIDWILRFHDPVFFWVKPQIRPEIVVPIGLQDNAKHDKALWLDSIRETLGLIAFKIGNQSTVLGERTLLKKLEWSTPTETRETVVRKHRSDAIIPLREERILFHRVTGELVSSYSDLSVDSGLIVVHSPLGYEHSGADWLALNPKIGHILGWQVDKSGLFKWTDQDGKVMVESIWWQDGFTGHHPPLLDDEVAEGWMVVASNDGFQRIKETYGTLERVVRISRELYDDGEKKEREIETKQDIATIN